jgi:SAM-dependent methyltransferase
MLRTVISEVGKGKSLSRTLLNLRCTSVELVGVGIDLDSKDGHASHYRFLNTERATITYSDLEPQATDVMELDLTQPFPIESGSQDFLLLFHVLEHLPDPNVCLAEACRILKPGGTLFGAVPFMHRVHPDPDDYFRYTGSALTMLSERAGFADSVIEPIGIGPNAVALNSVVGFIKLNPFKVAASLIAIGLDRTLQLLTGKRWVDVYPLAYFFEMKKPESR